MNLLLPTKNRQLIHKQIKGEQSFIIWCAAHCLWASSSSVHPVVCTPNKVSRQRPRACAERSISRSNFTWSQAKPSLAHLSFQGQFILRHINECQLFLVLHNQELCIWPEINQINQCTTQLCVLADQFHYNYSHRLYEVYSNK